MNTFLFFISLFLASVFSCLESRVHFAFSNDPIDVVIPSVEKDLLTLELCINGIKTNGANIRRVIIVSNKQLTDSAEWYSEESYPFSFQDIADTLSKGDPLIKAALLEKNSRTGWYYQQLLKFYAPLVIPGISSNVLVLDADTIFLNPVTFLNDKNGGMYNPGVEYHLPYFRHAAALIPGLCRCFPDYSGISHHMMFQRPVIEDLFAQVDRHHSEPFWKTFCRLVEMEHIFSSGASEYEIYFNYIFSRTDQASIRKLKWKNIRKLSEIPRLRKRGLHYVSIHSYDRKDLW